MIAAFENMTKSERANLIWSEGKFIGTTVYNARKVNLYRLNNDFFEMWFDVTGNLIDKIIPMSQPELFKPFVEQD
jgi:hypothetical protein